MGGWLRGAFITGIIENSDAWFCLVIRVFLLFDSVDRNLCGERPLGRLGRPAFAAGLVGARRRTLAGSLSRFVFGHFCLWAGRRYRSLMSCVRGCPAGGLRAAGVPTLF